MIGCLHPRVGEPSCHPAGQAHGDEGPAKPALFQEVSDCRLRVFKAEAGYGHLAVGRPEVDFSARLDQMVANNRVGRVDS